MITDEERATLLWAAREAEAAIGARDIRQARELIAAQHAIIEEAWQRTVQAGSTAALAEIAPSGAIPMPGRSLALLLHAPDPAPVSMPAALLPVGPALRGHPGRQFVHGMPRDPAFVSDCRPRSRLTAGASLGLDIGDTGGRDPDRARPVRGSGSFTNDASG